MPVSRLPKRRGHPTRKAAASRRPRVRPGSPEPAAEPRRDAPAGGARSQQTEKPGASGAPSGRGGDRSTTGASGGRNDDGARQSAHDRPSGADRRDTTGRGEDSRSPDIQRDRGKSAQQPQSQRPNRAEVDHRSGPGESPSGQEPSGPIASARPAPTAMTGWTGTARNRNNRTSERIDRERAEPRQIEIRREGDRATRDRTDQRDRATRDQRDGDRATGAQREERTGARQERSGSVRLTEDQRTRITEVISRQRDLPVSNVNVSVSVGATVPRSVRVRDTAARDRRDLSRVPGLPVHGRARRDRDRRSEDLSGRRGHPALGARDDRHQDLGARRSSRTSASRPKSGAGSRRSCCGNARTRAARISRSRWARSCRVTSPCFDFPDVIIREVAGNPGVPLLRPRRRSRAGRPARVSHRRSDRLTGTAPGGRPVAATARHARRGSGLLGRHRGGYCAAGARLAAGS